jgi:hypothetical protein
MKKTALWLLSCSIAALVGCSDSGRTGQTANNSSAPGDKQEFGSATDISRNGEMPSNRLNSADIGLGGPVQREVGNYKQHPTDTQHSDGELAKQIKVALTTGSTGTTGTIAADQLTPIDVQVQNGNVTLSGPVSSDAEKTTIGKQVAGFKGVKSVQNNLSVGQAARDQKPLQPLVPRGPGNQ